MLSGHGSCWVCFECQNKRKAATTLSLSPQSGSVERRDPAGRGRINQSLTFRLTIKSRLVSRRHSCGVSFLLLISRFTHWLSSCTLPSPSFQSAAVLDPSANLLSVIICLFPLRSPEHTLRESPLHLAVRWGLCRLAELLLCQPGGLMAVNLPNEEGVTPLQLARTAGHGELLQLLTQ